jgi:hypothetical protein
MVAINRKHGNRPRPTAYINGVKYPKNIRTRLGNRYGQYIFEMSKYNEGGELQEFGPLPTDGESTNVCSVPVGGNQLDPENEVVKEL